MSSTRSPVTIAGSTWKISSGVRLIRSWRPMADCKRARWRRSAVTALSFIVDLRHRNRVAPPDPLDDGFDHRALGLEGATLGDVEVDLQHSDVHARTYAA